jgi:molecular chaperone GrpE
MKKHKVENEPVQESGQTNIEEKHKEEISALNDKYLRLAADFDNYRRRTLKERQDLIMTAGEDLIIGILPVLDDFERAYEMLHKASGDNSTAIEGTELIYNKLFNFLSSKGLKVIEAIGSDLDTDFHEAVAQVPTEDPKMKNKIIEVLQKGYTLNGKVIRFAKVVVGQ